jgi:hypothetical protein
MTPSTKVLVYYGYTFGAETRSDALWQLERSMGSFRRHNPNIEARIFAYGEPPPGFRQIADRYAVAIEPAGDYRARLEAIAPECGDLLARYPVLPKYLALDRLRDASADTLLYVDADTYFLGPVELLLEAHRGADLYAREEPCSRRSALGYRPAYLNEELLRDIAAAEACNFVPPFNTGVMLFNRRSWERIADRLPFLVSCILRFMVFMALRSTRQGMRDLDLLREQVDLASLPSPLPYPSRNLFIREEVSMWLAAGREPGVSVDFFPTSHVLQGDEFERLADVSPVLIHYYSVNLPRFGAWLEAASAP